MKIPQPQVCMYICRPTVCVNNVIFTFVVVSFFIGRMVGGGVCEMDKNQRGKKRFRTTDLYLTCNPVGTLRHFFHINARYNQSPKLNIDPDKFRYSFRNIWSNSHVALLVFSCKFVHLDLSLRKIAI